MNDLNNTLIASAAQPSNALTMSSLEIAELTGKEHRSVLRDIRAMLGNLSEGGMHKTVHTPQGVLSFGDTYRNPQNGQEYPIFRLPQRECYILVSGYDITLRAKIIDRWMELEANLPRPTLPDLSDPVVLTSLLVEHASKRIEAERRAQAAEAKAEAMLPKVEAHDRLDASVGSICLTDAAKTLKMGPQKLIQFLSTRGWIYKRVGNSSWLGRQEKIAAGYLEHKEHVYKDSLLQERVATRALVTGRGLLKLAELLAQPLR